MFLRNDFIIPARDASQHTMVQTQWSEVGEGVFGLKNKAAISLPFNLHCKAIAAFEK